MKMKFRLLKNIDLESLDIQGKRICLCAIEEKYAPVIFEEFSDEITYFMFPKPAEKIEETLAYIHTTRKGMKEGFDLVFAILKKENKEFLGCCGFHGKSNPITPELGIWIKKSAHGEKYGREAIFTVTQWAVENVEFDYLIYPVDRDNIPSRKIPESLGGIVYEENKVKTMRGTYLNEVVYKITKNDITRNMAVGETAFRPA
jgi:[ribosomal protein S5]-alanine N-acetyltransferase